MNAFGRCLVLACSFTIGNMPSLVLADDSCDSLLRYGVFDEFIQKNDINVDKRIANWACNTRQTTQGGSFKYKDTIDLNLSSSGSNQDCATGEDGYKLTDKTLTYVKSVSAELTKAFNECMRSDGVHATVIFQDSSRTIVLKASSHFGGNVTPNPVKISYSDNELSCDLMRSERNKGVDARGELGVKCTRLQVYKPITVLFNFSSKHVATVKLAAYAKPPVVIPREKIIENVIGSYQVKIGPRGGCKTLPGDPMNAPQGNARIEKEGAGLVAYNECEQKTSVSVADQDNLFFFNEHAALKIERNSVIISADDQNTWVKTIQ